MVDISEFEDDALLEQAPADKEGREHPLAPFGIGLEGSVKSADDTDHADDPENEESEGGNQEQVGNPVMLTPEAAALSKPWR